MANEIACQTITGQTLTFAVYTAAGVERESGTAMTETPAGSGLYLGTPTTIVAGDKVIIDNGADKVGGGEYLPDVISTEIASDLSDMDDKLDTLIVVKQSVMDVIDDRDTT